MNNSALVGGVLLSFSVCFGQTPATPPALGYLDTFQGNYITQIAAAAATPLVNITNLGVHSAAPQTGDICANLYAFAPSTGNLITCCSCRVPPNALRTFSGPDLGTAVVASGSAVLKLVATLPGRLSPPCDPTVAPNAGNGLPGGFASGLEAWATHLPFLSPSDVKFAPAPLSSPELNKITAACSASPNRCTCSGGPV